MRGDESGLMFETLGRQVARWWPVWIGLWVAAVAVTEWIAPPWDEVVSHSEFRHLPDDMPTRLGGRLYDEAFPGDWSESSIVVVLRRPEDTLSAADYAFLGDRLVPGLEEIAQQRGGVIQKSLLARVRSALRELLPEEERPSPGSDTANAKHSESSHKRPDQKEDKQHHAPPLHEAVERDPQVVSIQAPYNSAAGPLLVSKDGQAMLVLVELTSSFLARENMPLIRGVEDLVAKLQKQEAYPEGLEIYLTGSAVVGRDVVAAVVQSAQIVRRWTLWLVFGLLLAVFRAPLIAMIPLTALLCAAQVALNLIAALAGEGYMSVFDGLKIYTTVILYGAGVDYSLFLISRYKEELLEGESIRSAMVIALAKVGAAVIISAGTEMFGIGMLVFADFGKLIEAGQAIPLGLAIILAASLTLTFALLRIVGRRGFWPLRVGREGGKTDQPRWQREGLTYALWLRVGKILGRWPGLSWLATVSLLSPLVFIAWLNSGNFNYDMVSELPPDSPSLAGNRVLKEHFSRGIVGPVTVLLQNEQAEFGGANSAAWLETLSNRIQNSGGALQLADVRCLANPMGTSDRADQLIRRLRELTPGSDDILPGENQLVAATKVDEPEAELFERVVLAAAREYYVSDAGTHAGHVTRMTLILADDPFARRSIERMGQLRSSIKQSLPDAIRAGTRVFLLGPTPSLFDMKTVADTDRRQIYLYVTSAVLLVLLLLMRKIVISLYLVLSVLFTYLVAMGATYTLFMVVEGAGFAGMEWSVPILLFTLLMAVGADYNVLLVQRCDEEEQQHGPVEGVTRALAATGGLISGAGVVMAGTFSALIWGGSLAGMQQLGFALTCGVLVDTFIVRPILVPSFLVMQQTYWPRFVRWLMKRESSMRRGPLLKGPLKQETESRDSAKK